MTSAMLTYLMYGFHADTCGNTLSYNLRALGLKKFVVVSYFITHYLLTLVVAVLFGLILDYSYSGIWLGLTLGFYSMAGLTYWKLKTLNWEKAVSEISLGLKKNPEIEMI